MHGINSINTTRSCINSTKLWEAGIAMDSLQNSDEIYTESMHFVITKFSLFHYFGQVDLHVA